MFLAAAAFFRIVNANGGWLVLLGAAGSAAGAYLFYNGFRLLRFKRMILDTPLSRIHSASIGLVEVTGTPVGPYILAAPITGDPCFYYRHGNGSRATPAKATSGNRSSTNPSLFRSFSRTAPAVS